MGTESTYAAKDDNFFQNTSSMHYYELTGFVYVLLCTSMYVCMGHCLPIEVGQ